MPRAFLSLIYIYRHAAVHTTASIANEEKPAYHILVYRVSRELRSPNRISIAHKFADESCERDGRVDASRRYQTLGMLACCFHGKCRADVQFSREDAIMRRADRRPRRDHERKRVRRNTILARSQSDVPAEIRGDSGRLTESTCAEVQWGGNFCDLPISARACAFAREGGIFQSAEYNVRRGK